MLPVQTNVPLPKPQRKTARRLFPYESLAVGAMFFVPNRKKNNLITHSSNVSKKLGRKFSTRLTHMVKEKGEWRPAEPTDPGAVQGIGVWRIS